LKSIDKFNVFFINPRSDTQPRFAELNAIRDAKAAMHARRLHRDLRDPAKPPLKTPERRPWEIYCEHGSQRFHEGFVTAATWIRSLPPGF